MSAGRLQQAILGASDRVNDLLYLPQFDEAGIDLQALRTARELLRVLAKTVGGMDVRKAFGAPGDWGYGNELGQGVLLLLSIEDRPSRDQMIQTEEKLARS